MQLQTRPRKSDSGYRVNGPVVLLIGSREMPVQCGNLLVSAGFDVAAVHSPDAPLQEWAARQKHTEHIREFSQFQSWAETIAYDYLFSVLNFRILPTALLNSPNICAINYHDAPLPKYAGSHACAWALHNREPTHGVSWHVMTPMVDAGDIIKQVTFPIAEGETLERLQQRCYLAAMRAFRDLLPELIAGTFTRTPQDLSQRTYYSRSMLPGPLTAK